MNNQKPSLLKLIGPGILVAATGVGAGDLATGAFTGSRLGVAVLWAVVLGAFLKFILTEGLARWQLATGETLLEGVCHRSGRVVDVFFLGYLVLWSFFVGGALISACGVAFHAILPMIDAEHDKIYYGIIHSAVAVVLVRLGGYRLFEKVMSVCIGVMFVTVVATAIAVRPDWSAIASGLLMPRIPQADGQGLGWTIALMGGVGGTLTVLCYGYWIREEGRTGLEDVKVCRVDLATGYLMTAIFGLGMVILGSRLEVGEGKGARLVVLIADELETSLGSVGPIGRWAFLLGAWGAVFSSLLGVWQSVPYLFADFLRIAKREENVKQVPVNVESRGYKLYLYALATIPLAGLFVEFQSLQKTYAIIGAAFMPLLALVLLFLNGQKRWIGERFRNSVFTNLLLILTLLFFILAGFYEYLPASWFH